MRRLGRFLKALWNYILHGHRVPFETFVIRLESCNWCNCVNKKDWKCDACGCYILKKAQMSTEKCPQDKWI